MAPGSGAKGRAAALLGAVARAICPASARGPSQLGCGRAWLPCPQGGPSLPLLSLPSSRCACNTGLSRTSPGGGRMGGEAEGSMPANNPPPTQHLATLPSSPPSPNCCHILGLFLELPSQGGSTQRHLWGDGREQTAASSLPQMHGELLCPAFPAPTGLTCLFFQALGFLGRWEGHFGQRGHLDPSFQRGRFCS